MALVRVIWLAVLTGVALVAAGAQASETVATEKPAEEGWILTLDANLSLEPDYPGASTSRVQKLPSFSFRRAGTPDDFSSPDDGLDFSVFDIDWLKAGPVAKLMGPRGKRSNPELKGLRPVDWTLEAGVFVEYWPMPWLRSRGELRQGLNGHEGLTGSLALDAVARVGAFTFAAGPRLDLANSQFMRRYFAVSAAEAAVNGRIAPFATHPGSYAMGMLASAAYTFSPAWTGTLWVQYQRLTGSAGNSPVARTLGSRNQASTGITLSYSFGIKGF